MSNTIRAKMKVTSITRRAGWNGHAEISDVQLNVVSGGSAENARFFAATPSGQLTLGTVRGDVADRFPIGAEFYVDLVPVNVEAPA